MKIKQIDIDQNQAIEFNDGSVEVDTVHTIEFDDGSTIHATEGYRIFSEHKQAFLNVSDLQEGDAI